jgi:hypothetical protein
MALTRIEQALLRLLFSVPYPLCEVYETEQRNSVDVMFCGLYVFRSVPPPSPWATTPGGEEPRTITHVVKE